MKRRLWFLMPVAIIALLLFSSLVLMAQAVRSYDLTRGEFFSQVTTNRAALKTAVAHTLYAALLPASPYSLDSVTLISPGGPQNWSLALSNNGISFVTLAQSGETSLLTGPAPAGHYQFQATGAGGTETLNARLSAPANAIAPLRISNLLPAQKIDSSQPFMLGWDKVAGVGPRDFIEVEVFATNGNHVFSGPRQGRTETNFIIQAGTLAPDSAYNAQLFLIHYFSYVTNRSPAQFIREERSTRFPLRTLNPAGVFKFRSSGFVGYEADGHATITVERTEGSQGDVAVDYFSADGTAADAVNYSAVSGTLNFPAGITNRTFDVLLMNDGASNTPMTVHLTLTNAVGGAGLVVRPHSTLTILDAQSATGPNIGACLIAKEEFYSHIQTLTDGPLTVSLNLGVERKFSVPLLTNWEEAQTINPAYPFTLQWAPFAGQTTNDYVRVVVYDQDGEYLVYTPNGFEPGVLPASTSTLAIPANTFDYGKRYQVDLIFVKVMTGGKLPSPAIRGGIVFTHTTVVYVHTLAAAGS